MFMLGLALLTTCSSAFADPITIVVGVMEVVAATGAADAVVAGMMYAAGALSIVGGITQNKSLEKIGGYLGLAAGVANMGIAVAKDLATSSTTLANAPDSIVANTPDVIAKPVTNAAADQSIGNTALSDLNTPVDATGNVANSTTVDTALNAPTGTASLPTTPGSEFSGAAHNVTNDPNLVSSSGAADLAAQPTAPISGSSAATPAPDANVSAPNTPAGANVNTGSGAGTTQMPAAQAGPWDTAAPQPGGGGFWKNFTADPGKWIDKNQTMVKMGGGLVQAAMQQFAPSGKDRAALMEAQLARDKFNYEKQRMANYNNSVIGASGTSIGYNPNAQPFAGGPQDPTRFVPNSAQLQIGQQWQPNQPTPGLINGSQG
jgi:hypothetical protein